MKILFFKEGSKVLTKKKKIFIICGMLVLLLVTGGLNLYLNNPSEDIQTTSSHVSLLTSYRASKMETRNSMLEMYDSIISTSKDSEQILETNAKISELAGRIETETVLEGMIMASGYEDVVVTNVDDSYTVMVKSNGLTADDVAKILGILVQETGVSATNVKISSV